MNKKHTNIVALFLFAVIIVGCAPVPIYNVNDAPILSADDTTISMKQVETAIKRAGLSLGWKMNSVKPGYIIATLHLRQHMAKVAIKYNTKHFSITYKDGSQLDYDGTNIHRNYNNWIHNLERAINVQLSTLQL